MPEKIWKKFVKDIKLIIPNIDSNVLNKLKSTFFEMSPDYFTSDKCKQLLSDTLKIIKDNKLKVYIYLLEFKKVLKATLKMKRKRLKFSTEVEEKKIKLTADNLENYIATNTEEELHNHDHENNVSDKVLDNIDFRDDTNVLLPEIYSIDVNDKIKIEKYIHKLENVLQATKIRIEKLEEEELTLDDLDNDMSAFVMLDKLKSHYVKVWKKVSKLRKSKCNLRKRYLKSFQFTGSSYTELNMDVENFVKMKKFPDYNDIRGLVLAFIKRNSLNLSSQKISELTVDIFTQIGNKLKKLRTNEFIQYFGNHLTDQVKIEDDPIIHDGPLRKVLHDNFVQGELNMDMVIEKFVNIQQSNDISNNDNESDISTEHSIDSDEEEANDNLEENLLQPPTDDQDDTVESNNPSSQTVLDPIEDNPDQQLSLIKYNPVTYQTMNSVPLENHITNYQISDNNQSLPISTCDLEVDSIEDAQPSEEYINEITSTTFQFNVDQMKNGERSTYYSEIIVLNSDDESDDNMDCSSSDDVIDVDKGNYAYSSKLDGFLITKSKINRAELIETVIDLDDDDDDDIQEIVPANTQPNSTEKR